ncbi:MULTISPECIES: lysoplasmalogenase [Bacillaceae]|uniref:Lysoplasmalogenase n=1 Tax=Evansella alkalicola TaxID=745819 RepID=A0ABS6JXE8_9BACI|nr:MULTISPECIES: lysoplasmalogenase [Bacillaceae]MBU9723263.1 lysoplasmalogenase [Bacillus alkalicola]
MKQYGLPIVTLVMSVLYIFFIPNDPTALKVTFKIIPMLLIILYAYQQFPSPNKNNSNNNEITDLTSDITADTAPNTKDKNTKLQAKPILWLVLIGLIFCMLGDGLLEGWFVIGLAAFLTGHVFYIAAFITKWEFSKIRMLTILPIGVYSFLIGSELISALSLSGDTELIVPVAAYTLIISLMLWFALMTKNKWAAIGSILFVASDSILAWNMFVSNINHSSILIMTTYYAAQFLIAHSLKKF